MARTPRVLVVYPHLPHYRYGVFKELADSSCVEFVFAADVVERTGSIATIDVAELPQRRLRNRFVGPVLWQSGLLREAVLRRYDAVIFLADATYLSTWLTAAILRVLRRPVLFWTIGWHRPEHGPKRRVRLSFYRLADRLLLYGNAARDIGASLGYPTERMSVIGNSADTPPRSNQVVSRPILPTYGPETLVVGAVVRLNPAKRLDLLVKAAAILREDGHDVVLLLVGDGPERDTLLHLAKVHGVPLHLPGAVYDHDTLRAVYDSLDVTVVPAAVGLTAVQSMAAGVPVVSDDDVHAQMPEWEAILPGVTGELSRAGDVRSLADAVLRVQQSLRERGTRVSLDCIAEVDRGWTAQSHARRILEALTQTEVCRPCAESGALR